MADVGRCPALHPENMDATCSDEHGRLDLVSSHMVGGGCAGLLCFERRQSLVRPVETLLDPTVRRRR